MDDDGINRRNTIKENATNNARTNNRGSDGEEPENAIIPFANSQGSSLQRQGGSDPAKAFFVTAKGFRITHYDQNQKVVLASGTPFSDDPPPYDQINNPLWSATKQKKDDFKDEFKRLSGKDQKTLSDEKYQISHEIPTIVTSEPGYENAFLTRLEAMGHSVTETRQVVNQTHALQQTISQRMTAVDQRTTAVDQRMSAVEHHLHERQPQSQLNEECISQRVVDRLVNNSRFLSMIQSREGSMTYSEVTDDVMEGSPPTHRCMRCNCKRLCTCRCHLTDLNKKWQREAVTDSPDRRYRQTSNNKEAIQDEREATVSDIESDLDVSRTFRNNLSYVSDSDHETPKSGDWRNEKDRKMSSVKEKEAEKSVYEANGASGGDPGGPPSDDSSNEDESDDGRRDKKSKNEKSDNDKTRKGAKRWIIDAVAWTICLDQENNFENEASNLLDQGKLPDQVLLNKICSKYTRFWPYLRNICDGICSFIKQKSDKIVHVWPAYQYKNDDRINGKEIIFVVLTAEPDDRDLSDFSTYIRCIFDVSSKKENREIKKKESNDRPSSEEMEDLEKCLKENARELMERHSKLTRVTASWFKSRGHDTDEFSLRKEQCIALYVHVKGFIPLHEEPFPKKVGNYPVDVREGIFTLCGGPNDYHKNVKMGCAIRGGLNKGTLGAFVEFENDSCVYGITSAHVVFTWDELRKIMEEGQMQFQYPNTQTVYQPDNETFGSTVAALYRTGGNGIPGMEIAVVEIRQDRWPTDGTFPDDSNHSKFGFGPHRPFVFCSGKVDQLSNLKHSPVVYKYGGESGITKGLYRVDGASVRTQTFKDNILGTELVMHDQIEIESVGTGTFGEHGDSGSLVVTHEQGNSELFAVGIFEGKMSDEDVYTVTPICSVLDELRRLTNKQCVLKRFPLHHSISSDSGYSGGVIENVTSLAATVSDLSKKVEKLDAHQNEIRDELRKQNQTLNEKTDKILQFLMSSQTQNDS